MILLAIGLTLAYMYDRHAVSRDVIELFFFTGGCELIAELIYLACKL